jgi:hypothetical protein
MRHPVAMAYARYSGQIPRKTSDPTPEQDVEVLVAEMVRLHDVTLQARVQLSRAKNAFDQKCANVFDLLSGVDP